MNSMYRNYTLLWTQTYTLHFWWTRPGAVQNNKSASYTSTGTCRHTAVIITELRKLRENSETGGVKLLMVLLVCAPVPTQLSSCSYIVELLFLHSWAPVPTQLSSCSYTVELLFLQSWAPVPTQLSSCSYIVELLFLHSWAPVPTPLSSSSYRVELLFLHSWAPVPTQLNTVEL